MSASRKVLIPGKHEVVITHGDRVRSPIAGAFATVTAGGTRIYLSRRARKDAGIEGRVVMTYNSVDDVLSFYPPIPRSRIQGFSCRTGRIESVRLAEVMGYVPQTTFLKIRVSEGCISIPLDQLRIPITQLALA